MSDIPLKKLDYQFIAAFQQYLLTDRKQIPNTVNKTLQKVSEVAKYAVKCGLIFFPPKGLAIKRQKPYPKRNTAFIYHSGYQQLYKNSGAISEPLAHSIVQPVTLKVRNKSKSFKGERT